MYFNFKYRFKLNYLNYYYHWNLSCLIGPYYLNNLNFDNLPILFLHQDAFSMIF